MSVSDQKSPIRADHRFIKQIAKSSLDGKVEYVPSEFDLIGRVFAKAGGSWQRIFQGGSARDVALLKQVIKAAFKNDELTKKFVFGPKS